MQELKHKYDYKVLSVHPSPGLEGPPAAAEPQGLSAALGCEGGLSLGCPGPAPWLHFASGLQLGDGLCQLCLSQSCSCFLHLQQTR